MTFRQSSFLFPLNRPFEFLSRNIFHTGYKCSGLKIQSGSLNLNEECQFNIDFGYLCDPVNTVEIRENIRNRKGTQDIDAFITLHKIWKGAKNDKDKKDIFKKLVNLAFKVPNKSHPQIAKLIEPKIIKTIGEQKVSKYKMYSFEDIVRKLNICRHNKITHFTGPRTYYLLGPLADLEQALIRYTIMVLKKHSFNVISVPDIIPRRVIENCGMETRGERTQVYSLDNTDLCLSGTAEMGIAYYLENKVIPVEKLPLKFAAVSRCFRAETSNISEEKGIYRVHQFNKVEMFGVSRPEMSEDLLSEFLHIEEEIFSSFGLTLRILDMPPYELGPQAYRKYDVEAWFPGKDYWGELSSTSNCIDYQSRRLNIKSSDGLFVHTVNGTACAVPRLIIALIETYQKENKTVQLPSVLAPFIRNTVISENRSLKLSPYKTRGGFG